MAGTHSEQMNHNTPRNDSSDLVVHTRQSLFVMLLVSALVTVGVTFQDTDRLRRALAEMDIVIALMKHWRTEASYPGIYPLTQIIAGPENSKPVAKMAINLYLVPLGNPEPPYNGKVRCKVVLDLNQYYFVTADRIPLYIAVHTEKDNADRLMISSFGDVSTNWNLVQRAPTDISGFAELWNTLVASEFALSIASVDPAAGTMSHYKKPQAISTDFKFDDRVHYKVFEFLESEHVEDESHFRQPIETGILTLRNYVYGQAYEANPQEEAVWENEIHGEILDNWKQHDVEALTAGFCETQLDNEESIYSRVLMPVTLNYHRSFDWVGAWFSQAKLTNNLNLDVIADSRPFDKAFAVLNQETAGLRRLPLRDLKNWLQLRYDRERENINILGITIPPSLLRLAGVILIVIVQVYVTLHLAEVTARISRSEAGDPGAFKPWILLYSGVVSKITTGCVISTPSLAALVVVSRLSTDELKTSLLGLTSFFGLIVSVCLSIFALKCARQLRRSAQIHLQANVPPTEARKDVSGI